jgi:hypothetical protein
MAIANVAGASSWPIKTIKSSGSAERYKVVTGASINPRIAMGDTVYINFVNSAHAYPRWLEIMASLAFILVGIGFIVGVLTPGMTAGLLFPTGLGAIWLVSKVSARMDATR